MSRGAPFGCFHSRASHTGCNSTNALCSLAGRLNQSFNKMPRKNRASGAPTRSSRPKAASIPASESPASAGTRATQVENSRLVQVTNCWLRGRACRVAGRCRVIHPAAESVPPYVVERLCHGCVNGIVLRVRLVCDCAILGFRVRFGLQRKVNREVRKIHEKGVIAIQTR
jgi:hypothetical protein